MTLTDPIQSLPPALLADLFDHTLSLPDIARRHAVPLPDLTRLVASPAVAEVAAAYAHAAAVRADLLRPVLQAHALAALAKVIQQMPTTPAHTECVRKAAGAVLRWKFPVPDTLPPDRPANRPPGPAPAARAAPPRRTRPRASPRPLRAPSLALLARARVPTARRRARPPLYGGCSPPVVVGGITAPRSRSPRTVRRRAG
jgi:hypothetical protein